MICAFLYSYHINCGMYTGKCLSPERSGIIGKSRDYNDYCCLCQMSHRHRSAKNRTFYVLMICSHCCVAAREATIAAIVARIGNVSNLTSDSVGKNGFIACSVNTQLRRFIASASSHPVHVKGP